MLHETGAADTAISRQNEVYNTTVQGGNGATAAIADGESRNVSAGDTITQQLKSATTVNDIRIAEVEVARETSNRSWAIEAVVVGDGSVGVYGFKLRKATL